MNKLCLGFCLGFLFIVHAQQLPPITATNTDKTANAACTDNLFSYLNITNGNWTACLAGSYKVLNPTNSISGTTNQITRATFLGVGAGNFSATFTDAVIIGNGARGNETFSATKNTVIGSLAMGTASFTNGSFTAIGYKALFTVDGGGGDATLGIGTQALSSAPSPFQTTAIGEFAMRDATNSSGDVAVGYRALLKQTGGALGSVAIGANALGSQTGAGNVGDNVVVGRNGFLASTTGNKNVGVGTVGYCDTPACGTIANALVTGSKNTFLGNYTGYADTTQYTESVAIGYNSRVGCSNCAVIGGTGADAVVLGANTTTPTVSGTGHIHIGGNTQRTVDALRTPASSSEACNIGEMAFDAAFVYTCTATNTWRRAATASF